MQGRNRLERVGADRRRATSLAASCCPSPGRALLRLLFAATFLSAGLTCVHAETYPRISAAEGTVVARKLGEEAQFVDLSTWRPVDVNQDLLAGDALRTNASGNLTIRFADKSLVRMGRNTTMVVKKISSTSDSVLSLTEGTIWARAARGGSKIEVETPAATAAIRGTDWTLTVNGDRTTLTVLEGAVELANAQGSVVVSQGEGATVTIGQAPSKYTLVNLKEREQMLIYSEIRGAFSSMSTSGADGRKTRADRRRILAMDPSIRSAEDWLSLAEASLVISGREDARAALAHLTRPLKGAAEARAKLVEAMLAGQQMQYAKAAGLFAEALPGLPRDRRATATYGLWFARSLAEPDRAFPPPNPNAFADDPEAVLLRAMLAAREEGTAAAIAVLAEGEKRFPGDARLPANRAGRALELDRRDEVREALAKAKALDPDEPYYLLISARFRTTVSSDVDGALVELQHAAAVAPGSSDIWNEIGLVYSERNAIVEADRAHRKAVQFDPENPVVRANYARLLIDYDQMAAAKREIDMASAIDPTSYAVLATRGRYLLKMGRTAEGEKDLLAAAAVNPTYGDALVGLAIASYQLEAVEETMQALDNADRFDPNNPSIPLIRSGIAIDEFKADEAVVQAREALRRRQERGGHYTGYDVNRQASSFLGLALQNLGMDEWGHYYSSRAYDPFKASTYNDESNKGRADPMINPGISGLDRFYLNGVGEGSGLQATLMDPMFIASEGRRNSIENRAFAELTATGALLSERSRTGWDSNLTLQGISYAGIPTSYLLEGSMTRPKSERDNDADDFTNGGFQLGLRPSLTDTVALFGMRTRWEQGLPGQITSASLVDRYASDQSTLGGAWSHIIEERNTIQAFVVRETIDDYQFMRQANEFGRLYDYDQYFKDTNWTGGLSHLYGIGPVTLHYGLELTQHDGSFEQIRTHTRHGFESRFFSADEALASRTYLDAIWDVTTDLKLQGGIYHSRIEGVDSEWGPFNPRIGVAWAPIDNHWLRAYYREDTALFSNYTLSPISTVSLVPMGVGLVNGGQSRTAGLHWDAEWSERFFTSVDYQHQQFSGLGVLYDDTSASISTTDGTIDRLNIAANYWIGGGFGSFASLTLNEGRDTRGPWKGYEVPLVPDYVAQVGLKYVHPSRITATIAQNFVGRRVGGQDYGYDPKTDSIQPIVGRLKPFATTDAALTWKSPNGRLEATFSVTNIFDQRFDSAYDVPAPGRTIWAGLTSRF